MILIICAWIFWFLISLSIGNAALKLLSRLTRDSLTTGYNIFYQFWFGFTTIIGLLQIISLFLPISKGVFILFCVLALLAVIINSAVILNKCVSVVKRFATVKGLLILLGVMVLLAFVSYSASKEATHTDTFIYHYNAVKWAKEYSVVPGLVNLHGRLGFNSSFFLFAALTEFGVYNGHSANIALSFLLVVGLIHWCFVILSPRSSMRARIFCMMTFVFIVIHIALKMDIASLATDYPMAMLVLVFCLVLIDKLRHKSLLLFSLSAVAFTFKLSAMPAIGIALMAALGYLFYVKYREPTTNVFKTERRLTWTSFTVLAVIIAGFVTRNIIVSGWLIYPFPIGNLHLPWSSPKPYVTDIINWIKSYPKIPGGASPETIEGHSFFYWFAPWFNHFSLSFEYFLLFISLIILLWSGLRVPKLMRFIYSKLSIVLLVSFALLSLVFWFTSAPDVRFGSVYFYILFAASVVLLYESSNQKNVLKLVIYGVFAFMIVHHTPAYMVDRDPLIFTFPYTNQPKLVRVKASPAAENPPLFIYMPAEGNQCGDSPIPCTPYAGGLLHKHQLVRQRVPGDLSKGFLPPE